MDAYTGFAQVYDLFMDNVPYQEWGEYLDNIFKKNGLDKGTVLDLGCGTGKLTRIMQAKGYDMIGVDNAMDMLEIAMSEESEGILYLLQDMRELELYGKVDGVYSACDCLNYILEEEDLLQIFNKVREYLDKDGVFVFDINTEYKYTELMADNTFAENREDSSFIWENYYDTHEQINEYDLTLFLRQSNDTFLRFQELHYQRFYSLETIIQLLEKAGFEVCSVFDGYTENKVSDESEKITIVAKVKG